MPDGRVDYWRHLRAACSRCASYPHEQGPFRQGAFWCGFWQSAILIPREQTIAEWTWLMLGLDFAPEDRDEWLEWVVRGWNAGRRPLAETGASAYTGHASNTSDTSLSSHGD